MSITVVFLQKDNPKTEFENSVVATDTITKSIVTDENVAAEEIDNTEVETIIFENTKHTIQRRKFEKAIKTKRSRNCCSSRNN
jgi:hypothetical protein